MNLSGWSQGVHRAVFLSRGKFSCFFQLLVSPHFLNHDPFVPSSMSAYWCYCRLTRFHITSLWPFVHLLILSLHVWENFSTFKTSHDYNEFTIIIQNNFLSRYIMSVTFAKSFGSWTVTYSQVQGADIFREPLFCLPQKGIISYFLVSLFLPFLPISFPSLSCYYFSIATF